MEIKTINVLGTEYTIEFQEVEFNKLLSDARGYIDWTTKKIVIANKSDEDTVDDFDYSQKKTLRHEIIHAFLVESGLESSTYNVDFGWARNEEMVDWFAIQSPKIYKVFEKVGCL